MYIRASVQTTMKKLFFLCPFLLLLTGCPVGLDYAPGTVGTEAVDTRFEGTWVLDASTPDHEVQKVTFEKLSKFAYTVTVVEVGEMYSMETDQFTMYQTNIDGLNVMYLKPSDEDKYYMYKFKFDSDKQMTIGDISLLEGGVDAVVSTEALRQEIATSKGKEDFANIEKYVFNKQ